MSFVENFSVFANAFATLVFTNALIDYVAKLIVNFLFNFLNFIQNEHDIKLRNHFNAADNDYYDLNAIYIYISFTLSILNRKEMMREAEVTDRLNIKHMYYILHDRTLRKIRLINICLHLEIATSISLTFIIDFDNHFDFLKTFVVVVQNIKFNVFSFTKRNIVFDIHISLLFNNESNFI